MLTLGDEVLRVTGLPIIVRSSEAGEPVIVRVDLRPTRNGAASRGDVGRIGIDGP